MTKRKSPCCPYCGKRVNPLMAFVLKDQGEYRCTKCRGISNVHLNYAIYRLAVVLVLTSAAILLIEEIFIRRFSWYSPLLVFLPFLIFYLLSPFYVELRRPIIKRKPIGHRAPNSITGGISDEVYAASLEGTQTDSGAEEPTVSVPSLYDRPAYRRQQRTAAPNEEPTIMMDHVSRRPAAQRPPRSRQEEVSPQKAVQQLEKNVAQQAHPVFYEKPQTKAPEGRYRAYRAPLGENQEEKHE
ncbi:MAG: hypothetical protein PHU79_03610 [Oscillospiraceae bacterium]|nr:hypothetical protein [Oscillospiraceae bacterium]